jgi:hypothetical protein
VIWGVIGLVADRVEAEIALPATRGAFNIVLRNIVKSSLRIFLSGAYRRIEVVDFK